MPHPSVKGRQNYNSQNSLGGGSLRHAASRGPSRIGAVIVKEEGRGDGG